MKRASGVLGLGLAILIGCTPVQQPPPQPTLPAFQPTVQHYIGSGCKGDHDTIYLPGVHINAYPGWPPNAQPEHIVLHYNNGSVIWGKPSYGNPGCSDYMTCQRATFILSPAWKQCRPQGHLYEVVTLDGKPVLESSLLQVIDPGTKAIVYIGFACGRGFAGPDVASLASQIQQSGCLSSSSQNAATSSSSSVAAPSQQGHPYLNAGVEIVGIALVAAAVLGTAYFAYRAAAVNAEAQNAPVTCTTTEFGGPQMPTWTTSCR